MKKILLTLFAVFCALASFSQGQVSGLVFYVTDSATYRSSTTITNAHSQGKADQCWNAQATTPHWDFWTGAAYEHVFTFAGSGGGGAWGTITGTLSDQTDLQTALDAKQYLINSATALVDGATIDVANIKNTLSTSSGTRTFTISYTGDEFTIEVTLNTTSSVFTFPATALTVSEGVASGNNTLSLSGVSGDKYIIASKKIGSNYYVVAKNFGQ